MRGAASQHRPLLFQAAFFGALLSAHFLAVHYFDPFGFFAVLAASRKACALGAPLLPGLRIFSSDPSFMRRRLAAIFAYSPGLLGI
jgi:hypothetical protein